MAETPEYGCVNKLRKRVCDLEDEKHSWDDLEHDDTVVTTNIIQLNHLCLQFHYGNYKDCFGLVELQRIRKSVSSQQPQNPDKKTLSLQRLLVVARSANARLFDPE